MATLLLRLVGPMQSWGSTSRFDERDTCKEPTKSGVLGILAAAMGIDRENWTDLEPLTHLVMGVRHDRPGVLRRDFQTAGQGTDDAGKGRIIKADGKSWSDDGIVSQRFYLADAAFLVGLEGEDRPLLESAHQKLADPTWPLFLGRKSYVPAESVFLADGLCDHALKEALAAYPWLGRGDPPHSVLCSFESADGSGRMVMDQPLSSFTERRFGARFVNTEWLELSREVTHVSV